MLGRHRVTRAELEVLRYVMDHQPVTVRQVADALAEHKQIARTTIQTLMDRLRKKNFLVRDLRDGVNFYSLGIAKAELLKDMVGDFVSTALGGSLSPFVAYLTDRAELSPKEMEDLKRLLDRIAEEEGR